MQRTAGVTFRDSIGTPLTHDAARILLLGSGEIGREIAIEAMRLGAEVIAADRYADAPAMQVAHRSHVLAMTDGAALRTLVEQEHPDVIVPEIEQINTAELVRLEEEGWTIIPRAEATRTTMDRERIRRLATETAGVPSSRYAFVNSLEEAKEAVPGIGFPCIFKAMMSSSGHGMSIVQSPQELEAAYLEASQGGRVPSPRAMIEEFIRFDMEVTMLTLRHFNPDGRVATTVLSPVAHVRPGTLYHESWQPADFTPEVIHKLNRIAVQVTDQLGGVGIFGVECFVRGTDVLFSEVSPRPHDTGLVTLGSQWNSEFALHARAILGLPYEGPEPATPAAAHVILGSSPGWAPRYRRLALALSPPGIRLFLFGKPQGFRDRRLGVAVARGSSVEEARARAETAAHAVESGIEYAAPQEPGTVSH